jgi:hypothetical protein
VGRKDGLTFVSRPSALTINITVLKGMKLTPAITDENCNIPFKPCITAVRVRTFQTKWKQDRGGKKTEKQMRKM